MKRVCENCGRVNWTRIDNQGNIICKCGYVFGNIHDHETPAEKEEF